MKLIGTPAAIAQWCTNSEGAAWGFQGPPFETSCDLHQAVREAAEQRAKSGEEAGPAPKPPPSKAEERRPTAKRKSVVPLVRVKPAPKQPPQGQSKAELDAGDKRPRAGQQKVGGDQSNAVGSGEGLEAFLGEYGSDSDD